MVAKVFEQVACAAQCAVGLIAEVLLFCAFHLWIGTHRFVELALEQRDLYAHFLQDKLADVFLGLEDALEEVDGIYLLLFQAGCDLLRFEDGLLGFYREIIVCHSLWYLGLFRGVYTQNAGQTQIGDVLAEKG